MEKRVPLAKEDEKEAFTMARDKSHHHSKIKLNTLIRIIIFLIHLNFCFCHFNFFLNNLNEQMCTLRK